jgi:hypothetical protein
MVPRSIMQVPAVPLLGTGKVDYPAVQRMVEAASAPQPQETVPA